MKTFETERLILRTYTLDDAEGAYEIYRDPEVCEFIRPDGPETSVENQREMLQKIITRYQELGNGFNCWAIVEKESDRVIGSAMLKPLPGHDEIEVGWHLGRWVWGKGYATESGGRLLEYGFKELGLQRIVAVVDPKNDRSLAVARRLGMNEEGIVRAYDHDLVLFAMKSFITTSKGGCK